MSLGVLQALRELRLRVPEDVAVVGFDDAPWVPHLSTPLTVVAQRPEELGAKAAQLLLRRLRREERREQPVVEVVPTELVVRESTAGRPAAREEVPTGNDTGIGL